MFVCADATPIHSLASRMVRTGIGFDSHRFAAGRRLVIGGVGIDCPVGLDGHSDADVLCHAVTDALLGAVAGGDIGTHFPDTDPQWRDADSLALLARVAAEQASKEVRINNVDTTVVAEKPKIGPHRDAIRENLAGALGISVARVSVKAKTAEQMGALGREEGIAVMSVVTVEQDGTD